MSTPAGYVILEINENEEETDGLKKDKTTHLAMFSFLGKQKEVIQEGKAEDSYDVNVQKGLKVLGLEQLIPEGGSTEGEEKEGEIFSRLRANRVLSWSRALKKDPIYAYFIGKMDLSCEAVFSACVNTKVFRPVVWLLLANQKINETDLQQLGFPVDFPSDYHRTWESLRNIFSDRREAEAQATFMENSYEAFSSGVIKLSDLRDFVRGRYEDRYVLITHGRDVLEMILSSKPVLTALKDKKIVDLNGLKLFMAQFLTNEVEPSFQTQILDFLHAMLSEKGLGAMRRLHFTLDKIIKHLSKSAECYIEKLVFFLEYGTIFLDKQITSQREIEKLLENSEMTHEAVVEKFKPALPMFTTRCES